MKNREEESMRVFIIYYIDFRVAWAIAQEAAVGSVAVVLVTRRPEAIAEAATGVWWWQ